MYLVERDDLSAGRAPACAAPPLRAVALAERALRRLWNLGLASEPRLDIGSLTAAARGAEGLDHFGHEDEWRAPFALLCDDLEGAARLSPLGRTMAHGQLVAVLRQRLRAAALWRRRPEMLERPIAPPIVVLGHMRSGTTRSQRLLACDPRLAHTRLFEMLNPVPFRRGPDLRLLRAFAGLQLLRRLNPALAAIHPTSPLAAEEEFGLLSFAFSPAQFEAQWRTPSLTRWGETADQRPVYAEFRRLLQTIAWSRGDAAARPWVLKAPQFMQDLGAVLEAFPGARLLVLKRDPAAVVASSASLVWNQMRVQSDATDRAAIGREWLRKTRLREERAAIALAAHSSVPRLTIDYDRMSADWRREMRRIYAFLGMPLTSAVEARMARYMARPAAHAGHRYRLEEFGLSQADIGYSASQTSSGTEPCRSSARIGMSWTAPSSSAAR